MTQLRFISHRGNINGKNTEKENHPIYIVEALSQGYEVEIDVWHKNGKFFLGHDTPQYEIDAKFLQNCNLWCHAKNDSALVEMSKLQNVHFFWHQEDHYTLTSQGIIWVYPGQRILEGSIVVLPEVIDNPNLYLGKCGGVCSDVIERYRYRTHKSS